MGFCWVIFPTWGCTEDLLKEEKTMICIHATSLLFSVPQSAFNMLGDWKKEGDEASFPQHGFSAHLSY